MLGSSSQCLPTEDVYCSLGMLVWHVDDVKLEMGVSMAREIVLDGSPKIFNSSTQQTNGARNTVRLLVGAAPGPAAMGRYIGHGGGLGPSKAGSREASPGIAVYGPRQISSSPGCLAPSLRRSLILRSSMYQPGSRQ